MVGPDVDLTCSFHSSGDVINKSADVEALAHNGGPTETMALPPSSPAVLRVPKDDCPDTDQRGKVLPSTGLEFCDAGAYELLPSTSSVTCKTGSLGSSLVLSNCTPSSPLYKSATLSEQNGNFYTLKWKSSNKKTELQVSESYPSTNHCGSGFTDEVFTGAVTGGNAAPTHFLDKVSIQACESVGSPSKYKLVPGTKALL